MTNPNRIIDILNQIKQTSSLTRKRSILQSLYRLDKKNITRFFQYVYSPYITFNITHPKEEELAVIDDYFKVPVNDLGTLLDKIEDLFLVKKLRGNAGKKALIQLNDSCNQETKKLLKMILDRDLDVGINTSIINKVIPKCIPTADYMGAVGFNGFIDLIERVQQYVSLTRVEEGEIIGLVQEKADGLFAFANLSTGQFISRRLKEIMFQDKKILKQVRDFRIFLEKHRYIDKKDIVTLHGELTIEGYPNRLEANGIFKALTTLALKEKEDSKEAKKYKAEFKKVFGISDREMREKIRYTVWDLTVNKDFNNQPNNLGRFSKLKNALTAFQKNTDGELIQLIETIFISKENIDDIIDFFEQQLKAGKEGVIFKVGYAKFETGHSTNCIKFKNIFDFDLRVVGFEEGKRKDTLGALVCESSDGKVKTKLSGIDKDLKKDIWENQEKYLNKICEGEANDITKSDKNDYYSLMHPRFIDFREDKDQADDLNKIINARNSFKLISKLKEDFKKMAELKNIKCSKCEL